MWPGSVARAWARSVCAEMHSGFAPLRNEMTMCIRERVDVRPWSTALERDIARVTEIWNDGRHRFAQGGAYLCGAFSLADAFYAPVAFRFRTYAVAPDGAAGDYLQALLAHPFLREWEAAALKETAVIEADEPRVIYRDKLAAHDMRPARHAELREARGASPRVLRDRAAMPARRIRAAARGEVAARHPRAVAPRTSTGEPHRRRVLDTTATPASSTTIRPSS